MNILVVDNKSKYLWDIINHLRKTKNIVVRVDPLKFDLKKLKKERIHGVIISGGSDEFWEEKSGFSSRIIEKFKDEPLLGICLGHEFLVEHYGGAIYKMHLKSEGMIYVNIIQENVLTQDRKRIRVFKAHGNAVAFLPECLKELGYSKDCETEIIKHKKRLHFGVQFHPEKGEDGYFILDNFLNTCKQMMR